jgi:bifunctional enzyme CysN/CysC
VSSSERGLLRLTTAGSVDDGKSTLIGRLLYDSKSIFADQLAAVKRASSARGDEEVDLALLTDGLRAEREQKITIDVAYRYFTTPRRKFIIADTPGHIQYTRNMVTGASTADVAIVLLDARNGVVTQSRRHAFIAALLNIAHIVVAVNKMDLVDYDQHAFERIVDDFRAFSEKIEVQDLVFIPMSALKGDNLIESSALMPWYQGATLLHHLENVNVTAGRNLVDFRFPVQYVARPNQDFRGFAGRIASGRIALEEEVVALPSGATSRIKSIQTYDGNLTEAFAGDSVLLTLHHEIDVSRGDMLVRKRNLPTRANVVDAMLCWMSDVEMSLQQSYILQHTVRRVSARISELAYRIDVDTMHRERSGRMEINDIGRVEITTAQPLFFDNYRLNRETGSFILIDPVTNATVAAGMFRGPTRALADVTTTTIRRQSQNITPDAGLVDRGSREQRNGHKAAVIWFTGLSGSGKSTIAKALEHRLFERGCQTMYIDGDNVRRGLCGDLGFSEADRAENIRRSGELAALCFEHGQLAICSFISPFEKDRELVRNMLPEGRFLEVFVHCPVEVCRQRDPKGLYARAESGEIPTFTGISSPYEIPTTPELVLDTTRLDVADCVARVLATLEKASITPFREVS